MEGSQKKRPHGVTVLAILGIFTGIFSVIGGAIFFVAGWLIMSDPENFGRLAGPGVVGSFNFPVSLVPPILTGIGVILLGLGTAFLITSYGIFKGKNWAWTFSLILAFVCVAISVVFMAFGGGDGQNALAVQLASGAVGIGIDAAILYYLFKPHVKTFFGKSTKH